MLTKSRLIFALVTLVLLSACGSSSDSNPAAAAECGFPTPRVAGTVATDQLANAPEQCGIVSYAWLRDPDLGKILGPGDGPQEFTPDELAQALLAANIQLPIQPRYTTAVERITYQTQDRGALIEATALIAYPTNLEDGFAADTLLYLHGTAGMSDLCAPSNPFPINDSVAFAAVFASLGHIMVMPDYIGLHSRRPSPSPPQLHPYLVGEPTAIASLDAVRAAGRLMASKAPSMCARPRVVPFGGSQGGHAALWVDRLAPYYAPELRLMGTVATVPPADLLAQGKRALGVPLADSFDNMVEFYTAASPWYGLGNSLSEVFLSNLDPATDWVNRLPEILATSCDANDFMQGITQPNEIFLQSFLESAASPDFADVMPWGCMVDENSLVSTSVNRITEDHDSYSVLFLLGGADQVVDPTIERASFASLCNEQGMPLQFLECEGASHRQASAWGMGEILEFIDDRFTETPVNASNLCQPNPAPIVCSGTPPPT
jgi:hypothetical protein